MKLLLFAIALTLLSATSTIAASPFYDGDENPAAPSSHDTSFSEDGTVYETSASDLSSYDGPANADFAVDDDISTAMLRSELESTSCGQNERRNRNGRCACARGYSRNSRRVCRRGDNSGGCPANERYNANGRCVCGRGFSRNRRGDCRSGDTDQCPRNERHNRRGNCVCKRGYVRNSRGVCRSSVPAPSPRPQCNTYDEPCRSDRDCMQGGFNPCTKCGKYKGTRYYKRCYNEDNMQSDEQIAFLSE